MMTAKIKTARINGGGESYRRQIFQSDFDKKPGRSPN
jgi:hypothetical protein